MNGMLKGRVSCMYSPRFCSPTIAHFVSETLMLPWGDANVVAETQGERRCDVAEIPGERRCDFAKIVSYSRAWETDTHEKYLEEELSVESKGCLTSTT